uniref:Uncharacterized protein n=1 Tax=Meloidogyne enterolobii TaxID=390850 RepID=A0A6V7TS44_MELEN|nr:unnamed protein product [Meloidogyne enterolobii]
MFQRSKCFNFTQCSKKPCPKNFKEFRYEIFREKFFCNLFWEVNLKTLKTNFRLIFSAHYLKCHFISFLLKTIKNKLLSMSTCITAVFLFLFILDDKKTILF